MSCSNPAWKATSWSSASRPIRRASAWAVSATLSSKGALDSVGFSRFTNPRRLSGVLRRSRRSSLSRRSARTRTCKSRIGIGFTIRSSPPASTIFARSGRGSNPVIISTGISAVAGAAFSRLQAAWPFMTGISTSIKIRSGLRSRAARTASSPLAAASVQKPSVESCPQSRSRFAPLSSVTRMVRRSGIGPEGGASTAIRRRKHDLPSLQGAVKRRVTQPSVPLAMKLPRLLSVEEVATAIRRHPEVVRRQARSGRLPAEKIGRVWFFRPERLAEAGFTQFLPTMTPSEAPAMQATDPPTESLVRALGAAGLEALRRPQQDAILEVVGRWLADAGFSTFVFLLADGKGLRCAFRRVAEPDTDFEKVAGQPAVGTIIPFDGAPILHTVCTTLRPHYLADADELVGRMAVAIPTVAASARP